MKAKIIFSLLTALAVIAVYASTEDKIVVIGAKGDVIEYNVSKIKEVTFSGKRMIITDDSGTHEYNVTDVDKVLGINDLRPVDLGLSVKWAPVNVGATEPGDYGSYFAWGETETKSSYFQNDSKWYGVDHTVLESHGVIDPLGNLTLMNDAATAKWGIKWRIPTCEEIAELINKCKWTWTTRDGHTGYMVTGPNGNFIFLPAAGGRYNYQHVDDGECGYYLSATSKDPQSAYGLYFKYNDYYNCTFFLKFDGLSVRPVTE